MEDKKFSGLSLTVIALLLMVLVGTGVYAYYASQATGTTTIRSLNYAFQVNNAETVNTSSFTITLPANKLQPGTQVAIPVELANVASEVAVDYTVSIKYAENSPVITNLDVCKVSATNGVCPDGNILSLGSTNTEVFADTIAVGDESLPLNIYLTWPYGESDSAVQDTADMNKTINLVVEVTGKQHNPNA